jgi:hemoglobin
MDTFHRIADAFYVRVEQDTLLRPMYPSSLDRAKEHLALFLAQFFGGPQTYSDNRGHPRLRMRHQRFEIGKAERDAWMKHMLAALDEAGIQEPALTPMVRYFEDAASFLINREAG